MGITEELKSLEDMKVKGTLTDAEFAAAKTATISKHTQPVTIATTSTPVQKRKSSVGRWLLFLGLGLFSSSGMSA